MSSSVLIHWEKRPPTNNQLYTNVYRKGRVISPKYRAWSSQYPPIKVNPQGENFNKIVDPFEIEYQIKKPDDKRKRDLANYEKALTDSLVKNDIIKDDCLIEKLVIKWFYKKTETDIIENEVSAWIKTI